MNQTAHTGIMLVVKTYLSFGRTINQEDGNLEVLRGLFLAGLPFSLFLCFNLVWSKLSPSQGTCLEISTVSWPLDWARGVNHTLLRAWDMWHNPLPVACVPQAVTWESPPADHGIVSAVPVPLQGEEFLHQDFPRVQILASSWPIRKLPLPSSFPHSFLSIPQPKVWPSLGWSAGVDWQENKAFV